jgi:cell division protein FtsW
MTTTRPGSPHLTEPEEPGRGPARAVVAVRRLFRAETPEYFWLLGTTLFIVALGLVMVLSASSIESFREAGADERTQADFFGRFLRQAVFAAVGIPLMLIMSRVPTSFWRRWAWHGLAGAMLVQLLVFVPGIGITDGGNSNWIRIAGFSMQPSEFVKLALVVWLAAVLTTKAARLHEWKHVFVPIAPVGGLAIGLVLVGGDLGTAGVMLLLVLGALFFAGVKLRIVGAWIALVAFVAFAFLMVSDGNRRHRIDAWLSGCSADAVDVTVDIERFCWQPQHGWWALADGGVFGVGLGNSTAKWSWLPAASNDFIFAVVGEELGILGAVLVLLLFATLAVCLVRIARMVRDPFQRIATMAVMVWLIGQAFVNIAVVLGLLPVLGVPLPLMSAGGSALLATLGAIGVVLSFARTRPAPAGIGQERLVP